MAIQRVEHVGIFVHNMQESIAFYETALGMEVKGRLQHNNEAVELVFLGFPGHQERIVELVGGHSDELPEAGIVNHLAFRVSDIANEVRRLHGLGVHFLHEEITTLRDGSQYIFFSGPNGEHLELFQPAGGR